MEETRPEVSRLNLSDDVTDGVHSEYGRPVVYCGIYRHEVGANDIVLKTGARNVVTGRGLTVHTCESYSAANMAESALGDSRFLLDIGQHTLFTNQSHAYWKAFVTLLDAVWCRWLAHNFLLTSP